MNERHPVSSVAGFDFFTATARPSRMGRIVANSFCGAVKQAVELKDCLGFGVEIVLHDAALH